MALIYEKKDHIALITINRPEAMNALDPETMDELGNAWFDVRDDPEVWVAIITGAGDKAFCVGADFKKTIPWITSEAITRQTSEMVIPAMLKGIDLWKPVIAAVNGYCLAGGMEMLQGTDIRIAAEHATFTVAEVRWGFFPGGGSPVRLPRQIPYCKAMEILLIGDRISAEEAYQIGLINKVVPLSELMPTAMKYAERICENGPLAVRSVKECVIRTSGLPLDQAYYVERMFSTIVFQSEDSQEGTKAFIEKRKPNYKGR